MHRYQLFSRRDSFIFIGLFIGITSALTMTRNRFLSFHLFTIAIIQRSIWWIHFLLFRIYWAFSHLNLIFLLIIFPQSDLRLALLNNWYLLLLFIILDILVRQSYYEWRFRPVWILPFWVTPFSGWRLRPISIPISIISCHPRCFFNLLLVLEILDMVIPLLTVPQIFNNVDIVDGTCKQL